MKRFDNDDVRGYAALITIILAIFLTIFCPNSCNSQNYYVPLYQEEPDTSLLDQLNVFRIGSQSYDTIFDDYGVPVKTITFTKVGFDMLYFLDNNYHFYVYPYTVILEQYRDYSIWGYSNIFSGEFVYDTNLLNLRLGYEYNRDLFGQSPFNIFYIDCSFWPNIE